jgi:tagatose 6-phosphate kinase
VSYIISLIIKMILTVTINPLLERRYLYSRLFFGEGNRNGKTELTAGGKGINVSRQLNKFNVENLAFTFLGGTNGKILKDLLNKEKINFTAIRTKSETRDAALVFNESDKSLTTFFGPDTIISDSEADEFKSKLEKIIQNSEIVVFSGSSPCTQTDSIFSFGIETANKYDKISVCDTYGNHLKDCIKAKPTVIHNNVSEVEKSLNISLNTKKEMLDYLDYLYGSGIKQSFITNGQYNTYSSNFDFKYEIENPEVDAIDSTGSGDSFTAGIVYGLHNNLPYEESIIIASSLGIVNAARFETCNVSPGEIEFIKPLIKINAAGKKIKNINVG